MIVISGKTSKGKDQIKINRFFTLEDLNKIGFLCAYKNEITQSLTKSIASKNDNNGIEMEEITVKIGKNKLTALLTTKEAKIQLIEAVEEFDRTIHNEIIRRSNLPKNVN